MVEEEPGVTRDRKVLTAEWAGVPFSVMDTGGWLAGGDALEAKVSQQAERALAEADVVLMVVDVTTGVTDEDLAAAKVIRRAGPPVRLVVNKVDDTEPGGRGLGVRRRSASATPSRSARCTAGGRATCSTRWSRLLPGTARRRTTRPTPPRPTGREPRPGEPARRGWPSSAGPTSASRPCSTG